LSDATADFDGRSPMLGGEKLVEKIVLPQVDFVPRPGNFWGGGRSSSKAVAKAVETD
jgi:hypothetical protein